MKGLLSSFTKHPETVGESYFEHMAMAFGFGTKMVIGGIACLLHGLFPFMCEKTGSSAVQKLHHTMVTHRDKRTQNAEDTANGMRA